MTSDFTDGTSLGARLGTKVTEHLVRGIVSARQQLAPHQKRVIDQVLVDWFRVMDSEAQAALSPVLGPLANDPDLPAHLRPLLGAVAAPHGQWQTFVAGSTTGALMGAGVLGFLTNELAPAINRAIASNPHGVLSPTDAAAAVALNIQRGVDYAFDAAAQGLDANRFRTLVDLHRAFPAPSVLQDLVNRNLYTVEGASGTLIRQGYTPDDANRIMALRRLHLTPQEAAAAWNRNIVSTDEGRDIAALAGMPAQDFDRLTELGGEPLAMQELLFAYRRGLIGEDRLNRGFVQGPVRNEWYDVFKALRYLPMPTGDALEAATKGHLTVDAARAIAQQNGLEPAHFDPLLESQGNPLGPEKMIDLWNRGIMSAAQVEQGIRESRVNNKYIPWFMASRFEVMPPETVRLMYQRGAMSKEDALRRLQERGYTAQDAAIILTGASAHKTRATRDLTVSQVTELYAQRLIAKADAATMLGALGFETDESDWILALADLARVRRLTSAVVARVRAAYVANRIDSTGASHLLDAAQVPPDARDDLLAVWDLERATPTRSLTLAQVQQAYRRGLFDQAAFVARLVGMGYAPEDADVIVKLTPAPAGP